MKRFLFTLFVCFMSVSVFSQWNTKRLLEIGKNAIYFDDYVNAIDNFNNIIRIKPYLAEPYFFRGLAKLGLDDYQGAERDFTDALNISPNYFHAYMYRGIARHNLGRYDEALKDYNLAIDLDPGNAFVYANRGITYAEMGENENAEQNFSRAIFIDSKQLGAYLNRAIVREKLGNIDGAIMDCNAAIKLNMFSDDAYGLRGYLWFQQKDYHSAIDDYNHALKANPSNVRIIMSRAMAWYEMKDYEKTMSDYSLAIEKDSTNIFAFYNRAMLRAELGDNNRAIDDLDHAALLNPENILVYFNRALIKMEINDQLGAYNDLTESIRLYPDFAKAYLARAAVNMEMKDERAAYTDRRTADEIMNRYKRMKDGDADALVDTSANFKKLIDINSNSDNLRDIVNGRLQDKKVIVELQNGFYFQYVSMDSLRTGRYTNYSKHVMDFNQRHNYNPAIVLSNRVIGYESGFVNEQIERLAQEIKDAPTLDNYLLRGSFYMSREDFMAAISDFEQMLRMEPNNMIAIVNLAEAKSRMYDFIASVNDKGTIVLGDSPKKRDQIDYTDVRKLYEEALRIDSEFGYLRFNLANSYAKNGQVEEAIRIYSEIIADGESIAEAYFNRGLLYIYQGDTKRANIDLSKAGELGITDAYNIIKRYCKIKRY
ncbi:MAG: tetratricopeptide repeat protein [Marinifilaceae bacterium]